MPSRRLSSIVRIVISVLAFITIFGKARAAEADPIQSIDKDGIVHILARTDAHPLGVFIESDYVASHGAASRQANVITQREAAQGNDAFTEAILYLRQSPHAAALLERLDHDGIRVSLVINHQCIGGQRIVESMNSLINWDPHCAYRTGKDSNSPALVLIHELVHAIHLAENPQAYLDNNGSKNNIFDTNEERLTIIYGEIPVARELGEAIRTDHHENRPFRVNDPTLR